MHIKTKILSQCILIPAAASLSIYLLNHLVFLILKRTDFSDRMTSMLSMTVLSMCIILFARKSNCGLSVFPQRFNILYIIATIITSLLFFFSPSVYTGNAESILITVYGSIVIPVFEELLFRDLLWNKMKTVIKNEWIVYIVDTILFGLWHIGYIDSIAFRVSDNIIKIMFWKVITGMLYGVLLGLLRKYAKNCYATMLLHSVLNTFAR